MISFYDMLTCTRAELQCTMQVALPQQLGLLLLTEVTQPPQPALEVSLPLSGNIQTSAS